ncbi:MAG TPA: 2-amino-4-hydroxy-6-hydroxymethyldihydropteridine diphosphokinase [Sedimentisphaerales bacterium]|nr:2-amino-4-hydroxy-6-hydroxymethyldihydropteridine diphosphokinase [Sedimentisphaerales bacterium]
MTERATAYIGLGSNLGDRERLLREALRILGANGDVEVTRVSDLKETVPLGGMDQPKYVNGVAEIRTTLKPAELMTGLKAVEAALGRQPQTSWQPRTVDLDLLFFDDQVLDGPDLTVPHPDIHLRSFVLDGLCQLNSEFVHPLLKESVGELSRRLAGGDFFLDPQAPRLVCVSGVIGVGKTTLARKLAESVPATVLCEPYDTNPFLSQVYAGKTELALDSQLYFLVHRAEQLSCDHLASDRVFVTDYVFHKELIYARRLLDGEQLRLYESIYPSFARRVATPSVVVYLEDSPANCLERIHRRNRPYEQRLKLEFLEALDADYKRLFAGWKTCPVIRIPATRLTGYSQEVVDRVVRQVLAYLPGQAQLTACMPRST